MAVAWVGEISSWGAPLTAIEVIVPHRRPRRWQAVLIERLGAAGHAVSVVRQPGGDRWPLPMAAALRFERRLFRRREAGLASLVPAIAEVPSSRTPDLRLDLSGVAGPSPVPTLSL